MFTYLLQSSTCLILFYGVYNFILSELTFFKYNRAYLLSTLVLSLLIPAIAPMLTMPPDISPNIQWTYMIPVEVSVISAHEEPFDYFTLLFSLGWVVYFVGVIVVLSRLIYGISKIYKIWKLGTKEPKNGFTLVHTEDVHLPYSFFTYVFISRHVPLSEHMNTILDHEIVHIHHWHTIDVLLAEIVHAFFWFNPVLIFYKNAIRQSHEFMADSIISVTSDKQQYSALLLSKSHTGLELALTNQFFHSQIKKRIIMLSKNESNCISIWKYALILPMIIALAIMFSSSKLSEIVNTDAMIHDSIPMAIGNPMLPQEVEKISIKDQVATITTKKGIIKYYYLDNKEDAETFKNFYGAAEMYIKTPPAPPLTPLPPNAQTAIPFMVPSQPLLAPIPPNPPLVPSFIIPPPPPSAPNPPNAPMNVPPMDPLPAPLSAIKIVGSPSDQYHFCGLTFIDGKLCLMSEVKNLNPEQIKSINVFKDEKAIQYTQKFGGNPEDGVILIETKNGFKSKSVDTDAAEVTNEIFKVVEEMPRFPGCEAEKEGFDRNNCASARMLEYIYKNIKYPTIAKTAGIEGQVILQFVINKSGQVENIKILRDIGGGCGEEAAKVFEKMNTEGLHWIPGKQKGRAVNVLYTIPIKFKLGSITSNSVGMQVPTPSATQMSKEDSEKMISKIFSEMPRFGTSPLGNTTSNPMKESNQMMTTFIKENLKYPAAAKINNIEGTCYIRVFLDDRGNITTAQIKEDIGFGCGEEALKVVKNMPQWTPASRDGTPISTSLIIPISFKLGQNKTEKGPIQNNDNSLQLVNVSIYPNPTSELLEISIHGTKEDVKVKIFDLMGKQLMSKTYPNDQENWKQSIDISQINQKMIFIQLTQGEKSTSQKIVVKK